MFSRPQRQTGKNESVGWTHSFCGVVRIWGILFLIPAWDLGGTDVWDGKPLSWQMKLHRVRANREGMRIKIR